MEDQVVNVKLLIGTIMAVFTGYTLPTMWDLPFSVLIPLSTMAEAQRKEQAFVAARGVISSSTPEGLTALEADRERVLYLDPKKEALLKSEDYVKRAEMIAQSILAKNKSKEG